MTATRLFLLMSLCLIQWLDVHRSIAADTQLPRTVRAALAASAHDLSPLSISWSEEYHTRIDPATAVAQLALNRKPDEYFAISYHRASWQNGKVYVYHHRNGSDAQGRKRTVREESFDGQIYYIGSETLLNRTLFKRLMSGIAVSEPDTRIDGAEYLTVSGLHLPEQFREFATPLPSALLEYELQNGSTLRSVEDTSVDGRTLLKVVIRTVNPIQKRGAEIDLEQLKEEKKYSPDPPELQKKLLDRVLKWRTLPTHLEKTYFLDPTIGCATVRWEESFPTGELLSRCDCTQFERIGDRALWLPKKCLVDYYWYETVPERVFTVPQLSKSYIVAQFRTTEVPESQFVLEYNETGTEIADGTLPESQAHADGYVRYSVPADPGDLDVVIEMARSENGSGIPWRIIFIGMNVAIIVGLAYYLWTRQRTSSHTRL